MEAKGQWIGIFKRDKSTILDSQSGNLHLVQQLFKTDKESRPFPEKQNMRDFSTNSPNLKKHFSKILYAKIKRL